MGLSPKPGGKRLRAGLNPTGKPNLGGGGGLKRSNLPKIPSNPNVNSGGVPTGLKKRLSILGRAIGGGKGSKSSSCGVDVTG